jgi:hypothetical protein
MRKALPYIVCKKINILYTRVIGLEDLLNKQAETCSLLNAVYC